jgi:hypothetical protein
MASIRSRISYALAPVATLTLLLGAAWAQRSHPSQRDFVPFFEKSAQSIAAIPTQIGPWIGRDLPPMQADIELLKPNAHRKIEFEDRSPRGLASTNRRVAVSVVQCRSSNDMQGHWPPNCYPRVLGDRLVSHDRRQWAVDELLIDGVEYQFEKTDNGRTIRRTVYNFMIVPTKGIVPDMETLAETAEDYRQRYFGAAQVQVVFQTLLGNELSREERDEVFVTLMREMKPALKVLKKSGE